jgi:hypothetical protein
MERTRFELVTSGLQSWGSAAEVRRNANSSGLPSACRLSASFHSAVAAEPGAALTSWTQAGSTGAVNYRSQRTRNIQRAACPNESGVLQDFFAPSPLKRAEKVLQNVTLRIG